MPSDRDAVGIARRAHTDAAKLRHAWDNYMAKLDDLSSILPCPSHWPADPPGPDTLGTRCDLLEGHIARNGTPHRHKVPGTQVVAEW